MRLKLARLGFLLNPQWQIFKIKSIQWKNNTFSTNNCFEFYFKALFIFFFKTQHRRPSKLRPALMQDYVTVHENIDFHKFMLCVRVCLLWAWSRHLTPLITLHTSICCLYIARNRLHTPGWKRCVHRTTFEVSARTKYISRWLKKKITAPQFGSIKRTMQKNKQTHKQTKNKIQWLAI